MDYPLKKTDMRPKKTKHEKRDDHLATGVRMAKSPTSSILRSGNPRRVFREPRGHRCHLFQPGIPTGSPYLGNPRSAVLQRAGSKIPSRGTALLLGRMPQRQEHRMQQSWPKLREEATEPDSDPNPNLNPEPDIWAKKTPVSEMSKKEVCTERSRT